MLSEEALVISTVVRWKQENPSVSIFVITVVATWGSSPRPKGCIMAISSDGRHVGSVSGGCVELDLLQRLSSSNATDQYPKRLTYGINADEAHQFGIPCGGRLDLFAEKLSSIDDFYLLENAYKQRKTYCREVNTRSGQSRVYPADQSQAFLIENNTLRKTYGPQWRLLIIGAGQLGQFLAQMAQCLDYSVILCEPRKELIIDWDFSRVKITGKMPDDAIQEYIKDQQCAVVTLTHTPNLDDMALMEALESPAFYVGALGSKTTSANRRKRLKSLGMAEPAINRLYAPIGLPIGSHTPAEIAISILAQITAVRNGINSGKSNSI